jgi:LuxR family maltose regulon positive regulatory protein
MQDRDTHAAKRRSDLSLSPAILHREELVKRLEEALLGISRVTGERETNYKLLMLCAPAGYGKTTLLIDFAQHADISCCWYFIERADTEPIKFLSHLIQSIRQQFPDFGKNVDILAAQVPLAVDTVASSGDKLQVEAILEALVLAMQRELSERFAIFLCGYHEVNESQEINDLVNRLLRKLPTQCIVVLESRAVPALDFAVLLARDEIIGFDHTFLDFTSVELHALARIRGVAPFNKQDAEQLTNLFGGWIAGILLGTRLGDTRIRGVRRDMYTFASMPDIPIDRQSLFAYLVNEVFDRDQEMFTFLKEISILPQITPELCDVVLERKDALLRLSYLERQGLFVTCIADGPQLLYSCHPVLRELFCDDLRKRHLERFIVLHQRVMDYWRTSQNYESAVYHAFEALLYDHAAYLILEAHKDLFAQGRLEILSGWIDALPGEVVALYPMLFVVRANIYLLLSEHVRALPLLKKASEAIEQQLCLVSGDELPFLHAAISIAHSKVLFQMGDYIQAQKLCEEMIKQLPMDEAELLADAYMCLGGCANMLGDLTSSIAHRQKALQLLGRNSERRQTAELHSALARTYGLTGMFALAEHHLTRASKCWDRLHDEWGRVNALLNIGLIKYLQGEFIVAESCFQQALSCARGTIHFRRGEAYALVNLGELYQDQGLYDESLVFMEDGLALARQLQDRYLVNYALCILAVTYLLMGDTMTSLFFVSEADAEAVNNKYDGDEKIRRELTRGRILLYQGKHQEAYTCFSELESYLRVSGLQWELLCTALRIAECLLVQQRMVEALNRLDKMATLILRNDYEQTVLRELHLLPHLECAIRSRPELERLRTILQTEIELKEISQAVTIPSIPELALSVPVVQTPLREKSQLQILALGEPAIFIDAKPVTRWRMARAMELFFLLLDSGRPLRKEQIITALWPEVDENINQTLHSTIHYLRKSLGDTCIGSHSGVYWLNIVPLYGEDYCYDVAEFLEHDQKAKKALVAHDDVTAKASLLVMMDLYRGDYVQPFYSNWCSFRRDKLRLLYLDARQQLALIAWRSEQFDESATQWQHILAVDSCLEEAHYGLMRCYMRQGKRGLALRQYQRCVEVLRHDLNVEPGSAIKNLLQHLSKSSVAK